MAIVVRSFFSRLQSVFLIIFFYLGCFAFASRPSTPNNKKKFSAFQFQYSKQGRLGNNLHLVNPWLYLKPIFSLNKKSKVRTAQTPIEPAASLCDSPDVILPTPSRKRSTGSFTEADLPADLIPNKKSTSFTFRSDITILVCSTCGEIFYGAPQLELHQSTKHAVSELYDGDSAKNIVNIIFQTGWKKGKDARSPPQIHRILKIHNSPKILARFEEYRESIKAKAAKMGGKRNRERCMADGNELLRFHCSTFLCSLGQDDCGGGGGLCGHEFCCVCGIIRGGFSPKLDGIPTLGSSRRAHEAIPEELEAEFGFMNVKRAMLVCRVVAGRVASDDLAAAAAAAEEEEEEQGQQMVGERDKEDGGFDSVVVRGGAHHGAVEGELLVFSPRAVLPCFVIVYSVTV
ncbi:hypothetical protein H6P81_006837 [Aristolochia fimbriata]|uniref:C2H2-type domain-containing protein n=1 Tax=Aristolochia fimbriata TaxID=158543 RepID=A0AAV7F2Z3_ARIFI|nr:hypothetical protein H6P81_006837 [Aristolochia fimbriata]